MKYYILVYRGPEECSFVAFIEKVNKIFHPAQNGQGDQEQSLPSNLFFIFNISNSFPFSRIN